MALFGPQILVWSVAVAACGLILHNTGYRPLKSPQAIEAQLGLYDLAAETPDTFVVYAGRLLLFVSTLAWAVVIGQSLVSAARRYRRTPAAVPPLQPLSPEEIEQQKSQTQALATSAPQQLTASARSIKPPPPPQQQQQTSDRNSRLEAQRRRFADQKQQQFDEAAAVRKQQQEREAAERKARAAAAAAQAAAQAAALHRQREEQQQQARAAELRQWERWEQAVLQQYRRSDGTAGGSHSGSGGGAAAEQSSPSAAGSSNQTAADHRIATAAAAAEQDRQLRQEQDHEFQESLAADQQRQQHKRQQQNLKHLKQLLQQKYAATGVMKDGSNGLPDGGLTLRVKMPDGGTAVRTFAGDQSVADVYEWVFSLDNMPDLPPGSWCLSATFPNQKILPAGSIWSPGGCSADGSELQQYILELQLTGSAAGGADSWGLSVRQITGEELLVLVQDDSTIIDVKEKVMLQTGAPPEAQGLIFSGRVLQDNFTLHQLGITADHTLQLSTALLPQPQPGTFGGGQGQLATHEQGDGDTADAGVVGRAGDNAKIEISSASSELIVSDVTQLRAEVAAGASQLVLYVVTEGS